MLYGMSLIYGVTGRHPARRRSPRSSRTVRRRARRLAYAAILFVVAGFAFKVSAVPFQFWAPDTYEGSPVPVAAFLAVGVEGGRVRGAAAADVRGVPPPGELLGADLRGPVDPHDDRREPRRAAAEQVVRLLAYSGIAQAGYILLPFALGREGRRQHQQAFSAAVAVPRDLRA